MSTTLLPSTILRKTMRIFGKLRLRCGTLPVLNHILLTADHHIVRLVVSHTALRRLRDSLPSVK